MLYADNKENKPKKTPAGRVNTPEDAQGPSFAPPELFKDDEDKEEEMEDHGGLSATEKEKKKALEKKERKGL